MAQASNFTITTSSESVGVPECYADQIFHLAPWETPILTACGLDSLPTPCTNPVYHYLEIEERPARTVLNGAISNSDTTIVMTNAVFAASEVVQIDEETIKLGTTSDNLTFASCTRSHGAGAAAAHSDLAPVTSLGLPRAQGAAAGTTGDLVIQPNDVTQYTQIFSKTIIVSGTSTSLQRYGRIGSELDYQALRQLMTMKKELQNSVIWGVATAAATTATAGEMDGIYERIVSTSTTDLSDANISHENMEDAVEASNDYGGRPNFVGCGLYSKRVFDSWGAPYVSHPTDPLDPVNMQYGTNVTRLDIGGANMSVMPMVDLHAHLLTLDSNLIGIGPLVGREFTKKTLGLDGDRERAQVVGEYTCAVPNPRAHYIFTSVAFT